METEAQALVAIAQAIEHLTEALAPSKQLLGFGAAPRTTQYVFCNRTHGGVWYTLDSQNQPVNIEHQALTGYIRKLEFVKAQRRGKEVCKLHCTVEAEQTYVLESAHDSNFSKGLLSGIAALPPEQLKQPLTIVPQPSAQQAEVLFCNVYQCDRQVFAPYDDQTDWRLCSRAAIDAVKAANGEATVTATLRQEVAA